MQGSVRPLSINNIHQNGAILAYEEPCRFCQPELRMFFIVLSKRKVCRTELRLSKDKIGQSHILSDQTARVYSLCWACARFSRQNCATSCTKRVLVL